MQRHWWSGGMVLVWLGSVGCSPAPVPQVVQYEFNDGGRYRVDCTYETDKRLEKTHEGKAFATTEEGVYVKTSMHMTAQRQPDQDWVIAYTLLRLRIHDRDGHFKLEMGPEGGELQWYQDKQPLSDYLTSDEFKAFQKLMQVPLARVRIHPNGVQVPNGLEFNFDLIRLLGKNRVYGEYLTRSVKVPPVLMTMFKAEPIKAGDRWDHQGNSSNANTHFRARAVSAKSLQVEYSSDLNLAADELRAVRKALRLDGVPGLELKTSRMTIRGVVGFDLPGKRPETAEMNFDKRYEMTLPQEVWKLHETERYRLNVEPVRD